LDQDLDLSLVKYDEYYVGLTKKELAHNDYWLIVIIEAAWYCESRNEDYIRRTQLKTGSDKSLNRITEGERSGFGGGAFASIINSRRCRRFLRVDKVNKKETRIYPNIPLIQKGVKSRQAENLEARNKRLRVIGDTDTVHHPRSISEPSLLISESLTRQTSKIRSLSDSLQISDRLSTVATHANTKEEIT
jgi:hypothetical protein